MTKIENPKKAFDESFASAQRLSDWISTPGAGLYDLINHDINVLLWARNALATLAEWRELYVTPDTARKR